jgi:FdhD protein
MSDLFLHSPDVECVTQPTIRVSVNRVEGAVDRPDEDVLAVEEPLEIRLGDRSLSITMRTPGNDSELAAGFLFAEGIVSTATQIVDISPSPDGNPNVIVVRLTADAMVKPAEPRRGFVITSACGVCGKESLEALQANRCPAITGDEFRVDPAILHSLPGRLRCAQTVFESTGGLHAAALFSAWGELRFLREDVGRHNAVDKLIGHALVNGRTPLSDSLMLVSGRASFELVQKALVAGIPVLAAVGAPSSMAVSTARKAGLTLIGFLRNGRFNVYSRPDRMADIAGCQDGLDRAAGVVRSRKTTYEEAAVQPHLD